MNIPRLQSTISSMFPNSQILNTIVPDEVIALQAAYLFGDNRSKSSADETFASSDREESVSICSTSASEQHLHISTYYVNREMLVEIPYYKYVDSIEFYVEDIYPHGQNENEDNDNVKLDLQIETEHSYSDFDSELLDDTYELSPLSLYDDDSTTSDL